MKFFQKLFHPSETTKKEIAESSTKKITTVSNDELKLLLEDLLQQGKKSLVENDHEKTLKILYDLILHDLYLRKIIDKQIMGTSTISPTTLQKSIELESYYNLTRTHLLMAIVDYLVQGYRVVEHKLSVEYKYAMDYYNYILNVHSYYFHCLDFLNKDSTDTIQTRVYEDCILILNEIFTNANEKIKEMLALAGLTTGS